MIGRRDFLRLGAAAGAGLVAVGGGLALVNRERDPHPAPLAEMRDHRATRAAGAPVFAVARGGDPATLTRAAVGALGGLGAFIRRGERVLLKPNIGWNRTPEQGANTSPEVVAELVRLARDAGAAEVWVADVPVNDAERCFARSGIADAARAAGARVVMPRRFTGTAVGGQRVRVAEVLDAALAADRIINVPVAKHHGLSGVTAAMKNWYGLLGGHRVVLHQDIHRAIVDLARFARPTLTVLDATRVLVSNGPSGGSPADVRRLDTVAASTDEVALDAFAAELLGRVPLELGFIREGERLGLGVSRWRELGPVEIGGAG